MKCGYPLSLQTAIGLKKIKTMEEELHSEVMGKGLGNVDLAEVKDVKEALYQVIKNDPVLLEKLKKIVSITDD